MTEKLYWLGNSAKVKIIGDVLKQVQESPSTKILIFDYGCGAAGDWPAILSDHSNLELVAYDPSRSSIAAAKTRLQGFNATLYTGDELDGVTFKARFVASFSVFEHVYNRRKYLQTAKDHLAADGIFYLNYDDGHFRNFLDLNAPRLWPNQLSVWLHNRLAEPLARAGYISQFQKRVNRANIDRLIAELGFDVQREFYSNLRSLKDMEKSIPDDKLEDFMRVWLALEDELNAHFLVEGQQEVLGDTANLWRFMGSRTLVLTHGQS